MDDALTRQDVGGLLDGKNAYRALAWISRDPMTMNSRNTQGRISELDSIRALAILLVIGCHYSGFCSLFGGLPSDGWIGVDIFFVLSGFLITSILIDLRSVQSPLRIFYIRRLLRIFPVYYLMVLIVSLLSLVCHEHLVHPGYYASRFLFLQSLRDAPVNFHRAWLTLHHAVSPDKEFARKTLPLIQMGAPLGPWGNSLGVAWSLSVEEYFYVFWAPIVLYLHDRWKVGAVALAIFGMSAAIQYLGCRGLPDYFDFVCRIDTIMAGAMLAMFLRWRRQAEIACRRMADGFLKVLAACLIAAIAVILFANRPLLKHELRDSLSFMAFGLPAFSILLALMIGWVVERRGESSPVLRALRWRPACYLGTISYSLYLFHLPVYYGFLRLAAQFRYAGAGARLTVSVAALLTSVLCSALSWKYFETPILRLKDRWVPAAGPDRQANAN